MTADPGVRPGQLAAPRAKHVFGSHEENMIIVHAHSTSHGSGLGRKEAGELIEDKLAYNESFHTDFAAGARRRDS